MLSRTKHASSGTEVVPAAFGSMAEVAAVAGCFAGVALGGTACALCCFSDQPLPDDVRAMYTRKWQTDMLSAPCSEPIWCGASFCCAPCVQYTLRTRALGGDMAAYRCCQGYFDICCFRAGKCGDEGNCACLALEVCCCPQFAVQGTRFYLMDTRLIASGPTDNKLLRFSNFLQVFACACEVSACVCGECGDAAMIIRCCANSVFATLVGCMSAQVAHELAAERNGAVAAPQPGMAPQPIVMGRPVTGTKQQV